MKNLLRSIILGALLLSPTVSLGGGGVMPEQTVAPHIVITTPPPEVNWIVPVSVAVLGVTGAIGAAWISTRKK
jgi:hypothetical protein